MSDPQPIATIDLDFLGLAEAIAVFALTGPQGTVLVECGPMSTLPRLVAQLAARGITPADVTDVLVTHVHLDHAGSAGWWARSGARIHVHRRGYQHLADPTRLIASASRVYGADMGRFWGDMPAAPEAHLVAHDDGDRISAGGLAIRCIDTPGHARHHLCFAFERALFTGDIAGIRLPGQLAAVAPTPPPDIDIAAWLGSLERIRRQQASRLFLTHFGEVVDADAHLDRVRDALSAAAARVADGLSRGLLREALIDDFAAWSRAVLAAQGVTGPILDAYLAANPPPMAVDGLMRYLGQQGNPPSAAAYAHA
ncbi:MAG: MBL fold metallo-hydrolase [Ardenticatenia bacterium]|nr:MBL fold metallo-hydrolase [Ardenticatenia bacterium]